MVAIKDSPEFAEMISAVNSAPDDMRIQLKFDIMIELLQRETSNAGAGIIISLISQFAVTVSTQQGFDPMMILANISKEARKMTREKLAEGGLSTSIPSTLKQ